MKPTIENIPAMEYLRDVDDNGLKLVIVGDHPSKLDDISVASCLHYDIPDYMGVNASAVGLYSFTDKAVFPFSYMATLHSYELGRDDLPKGHEFPESCVHPLTHVIGLRCGCESSRIDQTIAAEPVGGTSALFACIAGLVLGYKDIYLCGVRLEEGSIYHDENVVNNWEIWKPVLAPHLTVIGDSWLKEMYNECTR